MQLFPWIPAITTTALLALALWLFKLLVSNRVAKSVQHEFDNKIEAVRADLRASETRLQAELREKEAQISALRSGALSSLASRQAALDKRRLEAVDQLWESFNVLKSARAIAQTMAYVNYDAMAKALENDPAAIKVVEVLGAGAPNKELDLRGAAKARPFVSAMTWAIYLAIEAITTHAIARYVMLKVQLGNRGLVDNEGVEKLILAVLPHYADFIKKHGPSSYYHALEALDAQLLAETQKMLTSIDDDKANVARAAEIVQLAEELHTPKVLEKPAA